MKRLWAVLGRNNNENRLNNVDKTFYSTPYITIHYHILVELEQPEIISSVMSGIARAYSCYHHRAHKTAGYLWQGRFKSQPIEQELYLSACGRYIERNPVKVSIVSNAWEYDYSSAKFYVLGQTDSLTTQNPFFEVLPILLKAGRNTIRNIYKHLIKKKTVTLRTLNILADQLNL